MTGKRLSMLFLIAAEAVWCVGCLLTAMAIAYKIQAANDTHTLAEDPMELWIALGVSMLLLDRGSRWMRPK